MPFHFCVYCEVSKSGVLYPKLAFDCVLIACSLESIRPGLVQGYKAPNGVGSASSPPPLGLKLVTSPLALVKLYHHY